MSMFRNLGNARKLLSKAQRYAQQNPEKVRKFTDKAAAFADKQTKGRYRAQIDKAVRKADEFTGQRRGPRSGAPYPGPPGGPQPGGTQPGGTQPGSTQPGSTPLRTTRLGAQSPPQGQHSGQHPQPEQQFGSPYPPGQPGVNPGDPDPAAAQPPESPKSPETPKPGGPHYGPDKDRKDDSS
jgi:hypothetical protein